MMNVEERLATGDLALRDEKGLYTIVGRKSRF
jgi:acyl-CoA synthetase (AMP-forming)/AMP-acid ligase II